MSPWVRYLMAFVVFCHGFIYLRFLPDALEAWGGRSWLLGDALTPKLLRPLVLGLHVIAGSATLAAGVAIGVAASFPEWWRPLAIVGASAGIAAFAAFWGGRRERLVHEGGIGAVVSLILLASAMLGPVVFE